MERVIGNSLLQQQSAAQASSTSLPEETLADNPASDAVPKERTTIQLASSSRLNVLPVDIKKADASDIPEIQQFIGSLDDDSYQKRFLGPVDEDEGNLKEILEEDRQLTKEHVNTYFNNPENRVVFIARVDGQMVGIANVEDLSYAFKGFRVGDISRVVKLELQGKGVGSQLLAKADSYLQEKGIKYKSALVYSNNEGQMLRLLKNGWKEMTYSQKAVQSAALQDEDVEEREFWMALDPSCKDIEPQRKEHY